ncbi:hypothetical protein RBSWK_03835 [Rhodopirellula baltica SWK14]|uniref:Uncharacterized protein n=1 Tax=Rhodopirellula baltica SWK14 TaxID=993516 RepID=L7CGE5_RHOBT|nr:hypothetical protein RBSWK_03835 [Rhodopirellula baltica SWK14]
MSFASTAETTSCDVIFNQIGAKVFLTFRNSAEKSSPDLLVTFEIKTSRSEAKLFVGSSACASAVRKSGQETELRPSYDLRRRM